MCCASRSCQEKDQSLHATLFNFDTIHEEHGGPERLYRFLKQTCDVLTEPMKQAVVVSLGPLDNTMKGVSLSTNVQFLQKGASEHLYS